jgi:rubrerythrin
MPDPRLGARAPEPARTSPADPQPSKNVKDSSPRAEAFLCERCGEEMFRMHAVWRCPNCGFKTDCCGW